MLGTDYAQDYMVRGKAFQFRKRLTIPGSGDLELEFDFTKYGGIVFSQPIQMRSTGGLVYVDTYQRTSSTGGTAETVINLNETSDNVNATTVKSGVTSTGDKLLIREYTVGTKSTNQASGGGSAGFGVAKILDTSKPRYFYFANQETSDVVLEVEFIWYEI